MHVIDKIFTINLELVYKKVWLYRKKMKINYVLRMLAFVEYFQYSTKAGSKKNILRGFGGRMFLLIGIFSMLFFFPSG